MSSKKDLSCKVLLLGDSGVVKTWKISLYILLSIDLISSSANGVSFSSKILNFGEINKLI